MFAELPRTHKRLPRSNTCFAGGQQFRHRFRRWARFGFGFAWQMPEIHWAGQAASPKKKKLRLKPIRWVEASNFNPGPFDDCNGKKNQLYLGDWYIKCGGIMVSFGKRCSDYVHKYYLYILYIYIHNSYFLSSASRNHVLGCFGYVKVRRWTKNWFPWKCWIYSAKFGKRTKQWPFAGVSRSNDRLKELNNAMAKLHWKLFVHFQLSVLPVWVRTFCKNHDPVSCPKKIAGIWVVHC